MHRLDVSGRYAWLREVVVRPDEQRRGVGTALASIALRTFDPRQPVSAYTWEENGAGRPFAASLALTATDSYYSSPFGRGRESAWTTRWQGNVADVREKAATRPGVYDSVRRTLGSQR